jgi:hypothetical protein
MCQGFYRENGYMIQPMPIPMSKNQNSECAAYLTCSFGARRLKTPNATETRKANNSNA